MELVIGVSAHRNIRKDAEREVADAVKQALVRLRKKYDPIMLNGFAEGGDMLCGEIARELKINTRLVLPMSVRKYLSADFSDEGRALFETLSQAENVTGMTIAPDVERRAFFSGEREKVDYAYRQQSLYVGTQSDILLALWDGRDCDDTADACGTAFAVKKALQSAPNVKNRGAVIAVFSPREDKTYVCPPKSLRYLIAVSPSEYAEFTALPPLFEDMINRK